MPWAPCWNGFSRKACTGYSWVGAQGNGSPLSRAERKSLLDAAGAQMNGRLPLLAGCTSFTPSETIELAHHARLAGFDGVVFSPPPYLRPNDEEIFNFYKTVAAAVQLPIVVYNWPAGTGIDMSIRLLARISPRQYRRSDQAVEQPSGSFHSDALRAQRRGAGLRLHYGRSRHHADPSPRWLRDDRSGWCLGRTQPDFYNKLWSGDVDGARECGAKDCKLLEAWYTPELIGRHGAAPAVMKTGLMLRGVPMRNHVRAPFMDVRPEHVPAIRRTLEDPGCLDRSPLIGE